LTLPLPKGDFMISPHLARLVVLRPEIDKETLSNIYNVDKNFLRPISSSLEIDVNIKKEYDAFELEHATAAEFKGEILQAWFAHCVCLPNGAAFASIFPNFLRLWFLADLPRSEFIDVLALLQSRLAKTSYRSKSYAGKDNDQKVSDLSFLHATVKRKSLHVPAWEDQTKVKLVNLELKLLKFKLSIFPSSPSGTLVVCFYGSASNSTSFTELLDRLLSKGISPSVLMLIITGLHDKTVHAVEAFLALFIFCDFVDNCQERFVLDKRPAEYFESCLLDINFNHARDEAT